jgi:hypothetical protein
VVVVRKEKQVLLDHLEIFALAFILLTRDENAAKFEACAAHLGASNL